MAQVEHGSEPLMEQFRSLPYIDAYRVEAIIKPPTIQVRCKHANHLANAFSVEHFIPDFA